MYWRSPARSWSTKWSTTSGPSHPTTWLTALIPSLPLLLLQAIIFGRMFLGWWAIHTLSSIQTEAVKDLKDSGYFCLWSHHQRALTNARSLVMWGNENFAWSEIGANLRILFALGVQQGARRGAAVQSTQSWGPGTRRPDPARLSRHCSQPDEKADSAVLPTDAVLHDCRLQRLHPHAQFDQVPAQTVRGQRFVGIVNRAAPLVSWKKSKYHVSGALYPRASYPEYTFGAG